MTRRTFLLGVFACASALLAAEIVALRLHGEAMQKADCAIAPAMQQWLPLSRSWISTLRMIHKYMDSFVWLAIATGLINSTDPRGDLYAYVLVGHVVKNVLKSAILSPRSFWFCEQAVLYCGKGYSLPSGHSMMSLAFVLFVLWRWPRAWLAVVLLPMLPFVWFEVLYLGTHTRWDIVIGVTTGVAYFASYILFKPRLSASMRRAPFAALLVLFAGFISAMAFLETVEDDMDRHHAIPLEWQHAYERNCGLPTGSGAKGMHLRSGYDKTGLVAGLCVAYLLRRLLRNSRFGASFSDSIESVRVGFMSFIAMITYHYTRRFIIYAVEHLLPELQLAGINATRFVPSLLQPIAGLVLIPLLFHRRPKPKPQPKAD